jgi:hypothetical protein
MEEKIRLLRNEKRNLKRKIVRREERIAFLEIEKSLKDQKVEDHQISFLKSKFDKVPREYLITG